MNNKFTNAGREELLAVRRQSRSLYWTVALFSAFVNILMLTGPLYMMQVYDRVLGSRSEATLLALSLLVVFLYGMMGLLDYARGRIMARAGRAVPGGAGPAGVRRDDPPLGRGAGPDRADRPR